MSRPSIDSADGQSASGADVDVLGSRLGRKLLLRFIFAGIIPLLIFAVPLYLQTRNILDTLTHSTLISFTKLAKGQIFTTLDSARTRIESARLRMPAAALTPFRSLRLVPALPDSGLAGIFTDEQRALAQSGRVVMTAPYLTDGVFTVSLVTTPASGSGFIVGELEPSELWEVTGAGNYGPQDALIILDEEGRVLASSHEAVQWPAHILPAGLPIASRATGDSHFAELGECLWAMSDLWLEGALGSGRWGIMACRQRTAVTELPLVLFQSLLVMLMVATCVIVIFAFREARSFLTPVFRLAEATRMVAAGQWNTMIPPAGDDEMGDLVTAYNDMTRQLKDTHDERVRLTKEAMVGRLAAMVAHQVNTPLAAIKSKLGMMLRRNESLQQEGGIILEQVDRIGQIVKILLGFARQRSVFEHGADVRRIARNVVELFRPSFESRGIALRVEIPEEELPVGCRSDDVQEILVNLLENAREAVGATALREGGQRRNGEVYLVIRTVERSIEIVVDDNGPGLSEEPERAFDPFYTTKAHGTGLGLAIVRKICESARGDIRAGSGALGGACFTVRLPLREGRPDGGTNP